MTGREGNPHLSEEGKRYWEIGKGGAQIRWGTGGATRRCHRLLMKHAGMTSDQAWGYCAERHHAVTGRWPGENKKGKRMTAPAAGAGLFIRSWPLEDIRIIRTVDGGADGRTVEAYAAVFDRPAEIRDHQGHYFEEIDPTAFNRAIDHARPAGMRSHWTTGVYYNHGLTLQGTPSDRATVPIGTTLDVRAEARGLLTVTRYNRTPLADEVLEAIQSGSVRAQSFSGRTIRSTPELTAGHVYRPARGSTEPPTVRRMELGLREYGPTPMPAYEGAAILGVRALLLDQLDLCDDCTQRALATPSEDSAGADATPCGCGDSATHGTPADAGPAADHRPVGRSDRHSHDALVRRIAAARITVPGLGRREP